MSSHCTHRTPCCDEEEDRKDSDEKERDAKKQELEAKEKEDHLNDLKNDTPKNQRADSRAES